MRSFFVCVLLACAPLLGGFAGADATVETRQVCATTTTCAPTTACSYDATRALPEPVPPAPAGFCQQTPCDPATACYSAARANETCVVNTSIDGETCSVSASGDLRVGGRSMPVPTSVGAIPLPTGVSSVTVPGTRVGGHAALTDGFVMAKDLPNEWFSHHAGAYATVAGVDLGSVDAGLYKTDIDTADGDRFTHVALTIVQVGPVGGETVLVKVILLDNALEECWVQAAGTSATCSESAQRARALLP